LEITFLGGSREVGRSAVLVSYKNTNLLLDYGVKLNDHPEFPLHVEPRKIDAVILTHAHLDHSGCVPMLYVSHGPQFYATQMTVETSTLLIEDFIKLSSYYLPFETPEMEKMRTRLKPVYYREPFTVKDLEVEFIDAGHIPGSAQILVKGEKTLIYTGDFTMTRSRLLDGADVQNGDVDGVVIESTYAREDHRDRGELERQFVEACREVVENGGRVLVPAFSVGRAQELMCVLFARNFRHPVWLDGMARQTLEQYLRSRRFVDGYDLLAKASRRVRIVNGRRGRETALSEPGVIISPAGMLRGGPAVLYASEIIEDSRSAVFLVSFQIPGTPGAQLLGEKRILANGREKRAACRIEQYKFSAHAGRSELHAYLKRIEGAAKVFAVHGEDESCQALSTWAETELGLEATAPQSGQKFMV